MGSNGIASEENEIDSLELIEGELVEADGLCSIGDVQSFRV